jgi:hypothetical protein
MVSPFSGHVAVGLTYSNHQETIDINRYLFIDVPKPRIVRKLTAFFYGNDSPGSIASQLYNACNDKYNLQVTEYICNLYSHWQRCRYKIHMSEYYNVRLHKFIWINGTALNQLEEVKPEGKVMDVGIDCTGCSSLIRNKLKDVKHV